MTTLHIYTRVSTMAQADNNTSLGTQLELGIQRARELGFDFNHWNEGGRSSHHEDIEGRPILFRLFQAIKAGEVKHLWVYDQSRLSRNDQVASIFRYQCNKQGVRIYTKDGQFNLSSPQDNFLKQLLDATAEFDNALRAERTRIGKLARVKSGQWHGGPPPYGYRVTSKRLEINPRESHWVMEIFNQFLQGVSLADIKLHLEFNRVAPRRGKPQWSIGSLRALLGNTHYRGEYYFKDKRYPDSISVECPRILDDVIWNAAQHRKKVVSNQTRADNTLKHFYLLRGLLFCGHCGLLIAGRINQFKRESLYYCPCKSRLWAKIGFSEKPWERGNGCGLARSLNIQRTDDLVWNIVNQINDNGGELNQNITNAIASAHGLVNAPPAPDPTQVEKLTADLNKALSIQGTLLTQFKLGDISNEIYQSSSSAVHHRINELSHAITSLKLNLQEALKRAKWQHWLDEFGNREIRREALTEEQQRDYLQGIIQRITVKWQPDSGSHDVKVDFSFEVGEAENAVG